MNKEELQKKIQQKEKTAADMRGIGEAYIRGDVLKDHVAAEAWLMKVVELEDNLESPLAMALILREILGQEQILTDEDYLQMRGEYEKLCQVEKDEAAGYMEEGKKDASNVMLQMENEYGNTEKKKELEILMGLATERQRKL